LRAAHDLNYDQRTEGSIYLYRTAKSFVAARAAALGIDDPRVRQSLCQGMPFSRAGCTMTKTKAGMRGCL